MGELQSKEGETEKEGWNWKRYVSPDHPEQLTATQRLAALCKLKYTVYAPEVEQLPDTRLRLFLWKIPSGGPASRYERELTIWGTRDNPAFVIEMNTPPWQSESGVRVREEIDLGTGTADDEELAVRIAAAMEAATALPGMPMSRFHYPDWIARGEATARGRMPSK